MRKRFVILAVFAALGASGAHAADQGRARSDRDRLIGAWHMVSMEEEGPGGTMTHHTERTGMLVYSADGHVSVQVMYPASEAGTTANAAYQQDGYEASFGSFDVDEQTHTVTHHVQGSLVRSLIGKNLPRVMQFSSDGHLTLRSADAREKWSVTWEHD
jgi:hypothetical protein